MTLVQDPCIPTLLVLLRLRVNLFRAFCVRSNSEQAARAGGKVQRQELLTEQYSTTDSWSLRRMNVQLFPNRCIKVASGAGFVHFLQHQAPMID